ncbi:structural protein [Vibrio algarum]|uniref:Structural protein n=1 Tax=Vibrio algarum TaxID=3020714 RepID=A0ABT4YNP0_9VIBR|nr:structural protein [Vibrio sp. KJ40-1]MDB1122841.1 structural protein [Vibrio sp. KJ40-1]
MKMLVIGVLAVIAIKYVTRPKLTNDELLYLNGGAMSRVNRGIRNNNPLNIKEGNNWQGESDTNIDPVFEEFEHPKYGFRAGAKLLRNYEKLYGLNSVRGIISKFAPSSENHTENYITFVAKELGVNSENTLNLWDDDLLARMLHAMSIMENGRHYSLSEAKKGVELA